MARIPDITRITLSTRLEAHRAARWPQLTRLVVRFRGEYAYIDADEDSFLPNGQAIGTPEEAIDCACGLYLGDPTAWT